ncbi:MULTISPECIES: hypothetical protein [Aneurinibacillus]|uniref:Uncharacterized protein n=1 Tax=Aneurinibacillus thermoaerophilus TaxID=143495 RepID=A0A1G7ZLK5_ANETH|nr:MULTISPECIES: hypothetical protein [Aneurinibacillus]AMA72446.1 hypothetical protein ACH33_06000 [Aneurinibacillus sp. XH2]MED0675674.1 hypothetical protein [Aneurinibacillus thermoaerophilus]MED0735575.1 hypothetical protein [Aneurinibacillus thermoaerophilus]MED0758772.1 hypothetical protein [Aneurinibacillus thermoaerophilus]MED0759452.1 hypothetical protein [Aneurinibacillus thermoaerophilus]
MQYLYLHRITNNKQQEAQYVYRFDDHRLSPGNLVIRKLFYCMLQALQDELTDVEIEYNDAEIVKFAGMERAVAFLTLMGAQKAEQREYRKDGVLLSRTFTTKLTPERLTYFFGLQDLDEVYRLRFLAGEEERIHLYFASTLSCRLSFQKEETFLALLERHRVPHKILEAKR